MVAVRDIPTMLDGAAVLAKDRDRAIAVPPPGVDLMGAIDAAAWHSPAWRVPMAGLWVPRLSPDVDGSPYLREPVRLALAANSPAADQMAWSEPRSRDQLAGLMAAAWCDLCGRPATLTARSLGYADTDPDLDLRSVRRAAQRGRTLWWRLDVWPWALMPNGYEPDWWLNPSIRQEWRTWIDPASWKHVWWRRR